MAVSKRSYPFFALKIRKLYQAKFLTFARYVTTSCMSVGSQNEGLKWLLIFSNPKP